jgi:RNA recognition motif-containing protein
MEGIRQPKIIEKSLKSRCIYVRGISRTTSTDSVRSHFQILGLIESIEFNENPRQGFCWLTFATQKSADCAVKELHHSTLNGSLITVRFELGRDTVTGEILQHEIKSG